MYESFVKSPRIENWGFSQKPLAMAELNSNEEPNVLPSKRKLPSQTLDIDNTNDDDVKKLRPENNTTSAAAVEEKTVTENGDDEDEEEDYEAEDEIDSEDDGEDDDDDDEHSNGAIEIDRKGKGIMKDDKGKGKMIEESDDDSDSDSDDDLNESDGEDDDDLSDDPLAEVDLDNILPSRTRGRTVSSGLRISSNDDKNDKNN